ncbi:MAG: hypothetical protein WAN86_02580, partial [Hyphomicrobiaceae bacterium]
RVGAEERPSLTAARHDGECSAIRIKPQSDRSASQSYPLTSPRRPFFVPRSRNFGLKQQHSVLEQEAAAAKAELHDKTALIEKLRFELDILKRNRFGRSSEKLERQIDQLELTLEELEIDQAQRRPADVPCGNDESCKRTPRRRTSSYRSAGLLDSSSARDCRTQGALRLPPLPGHQTRLHRHR